MTFAPYIETLASWFQIVRIFLKITLFLHQPSTNTNQHEQAQKLGKVKP